MKPINGPSWKQAIAVGASLMLGLAAIPSGVEAQNSSDQSINTDIFRNNNFNTDSYILGPGDRIQINLWDLPEYSGRFIVGPDGQIFIPGLKDSVSAEGLTIEELKKELTDRFKVFVKAPRVFIFPVQYRSVRLYIGGEVRRPGLYSIQIDAIKGDQNLFDRDNRGPSKTYLDDAPTNNFIYPTVYDALRRAEGITPYSDLANVQVTRKLPISSNGKKIRTKLNILSLITEGDESQNIRLFDGDVITVARSPQILRDQVKKARQTNLSPEYFQVYVSGRVLQPGPVKMPNGATLNQAIAVAGGAKLLRGKVEFVRFDSEDKMDRRIFSYNPKAPKDAYKNPVLVAGDIIRVRDSLISATAEIVGEITRPAIGIFSVYKIFGD